MKVLFSMWYSWKIAHLVLINNHHLPPLKWTSMWLIPMNKKLCYSWVCIFTTSYCMYTIWLKLRHLFSFTDTSQHGRNSITGHVGVTLCHRPMKMALRWLWNGYNFKLNCFVCYEQLNWSKKVITHIFHEMYMT